MSWLSAASPPLRGAPPATLESRALFRVQAAALVEPAAPQKTDPNVVIVTKANGEVIAFTASDKLTILAAHRVRRRPVTPSTPTPSAA